MKRRPIRQRIYCYGGGGLSNVKMTQFIDLNKITTDKEILPEHRDELEVKIKNFSMWALGEAAVTEMTKTVRDNESNK